MVNEFSGRTFPCSAFAPSGAGYEGATGLEHVCTAVGSVAGSGFVDGDVYLATAFRYYKAHKWRNIGIIIAEAIFLMGLYLLASGMFSLPSCPAVFLINPVCRIHLVEEKQRRGPPIPSRSRP